MIITKLSNTGVRKVTVENYHAAVLTLDGRAYVWGRNDHNQVTMDTNVDQSSPKLYIGTKDERVKDIVCGEYFTALLTNHRKVVYFGKEATKTLILYQNHNQSQEENQIHLFCNILSSSHYTILNVNSFIDNFFVNILLVEQKSLEEMLAVQSCVIKPLQKKTITMSNAQLFDELCRSYLDLLYFWAANVQSLLEHSNGMISLCDIIVFKHLEEFIFIYKQYVNVITDIISIDGFQNISKIIDIPQSLYKMRPEIQKKDKNNEENITSNFLQAPVEKIEHYTIFIKNYLGPNSDAMIRWNVFVDEQNNKKQEALSTKNFWSDSGRGIEFLKSPKRRLVRDSHTFPIFLQNAGRFTSHWFILFSDLFVHVNGSTPHLHDLTTIWLEPQQDETTQQYLINLKMPEDNLILYTHEAEGKIDWFHSLQNAIKRALNKKDALQPPNGRNASYTFMKSGFFKEATYTGRWSNGKMLGSGKLQWPDGKTYSGQFSNNQLSGYGVMEIPNVGNRLTFQVPFVLTFQFRYLRGTMAR